MQAFSRTTMLAIMIVSFLIAGCTGAIVGGGAAWMYIQQSGVPLTSQNADQAEVHFVTAKQTEPESVQAAAGDTGTVQAAVGDTGVVSVVKRSSPAVVTVINTLSSSQRNGQSVAQRASGSGVVIKADGYIVTNNHVVEGQQSLAVIFADGTRQDATLVGTDPLNDLAVLKVDGKVPGYLALGDSDALQPGETVIAIGSPLGNFKNSVTVGVVSALNRTVGDSPEGLVQTDAAINSGNSGGPLINMNGEVIGINTLVVRSENMGSAPVEGMGFAIPSSTVRLVSDELIANGKINHPFLGVSYVQLDPDVAATQGLSVQQGALLNQVDPSGPAGRAGLRNGDIIVSINGTILNDSTSLRRIMMQYKPNEQVKLEVLRNGKTQTFTVKLGTRPNA